MSDQSWRKVYVGREKEMKLLQNAWEKAKHNEPQFVTFLAETGVGKTRLVQHFYSWLNKVDDPENYWPDTLENQDASLAVNPNFPEDWVTCDIPWLWWGLRAQDPTNRNQQESIGSSIHEAVLKLNPHVEPIVLKRHKNKLTKSTGFAIIGAIVTLSTLGGKDIVFNVYDLGKKYIEEKDRQKKEKLTIPETSKQKESDASEKVFDFLKTILDKRDIDAVTVPVVLILDDAQWLDRSTLNFVEILWQAACKEQWPLLIIATHWLREWRENETRNQIVPPEQPPISLVNLIHRNPALFNDWKPHELHLMPNNDLRTILISALPGLTQYQQDCILERVGGNPQFLDDLLLWIFENKRLFFDKRDCCLSLTESGEKLVSKIGMGHQGHMELVRKRFNALEEDMRYLLGLSSYQGMCFLEPLTLEVIRQIDGDDDIDWQGFFGKAIHPYSVIDSISNTFDEFRQRNMFEIARNHLQEGDEDGFRLALLNVLRLWFESGRIAEQPLTEQETLLRLLIRELEDVLEESKFLFRVQMNLLIVYSDRYRFLDAARLALQMVNAMPDEVKILSLNKQRFLALTIGYCSNEHVSIRLYDNIILQMQHRIRKDEKWQNKLADDLIIRGYFLSQLNQPSDALENYNKAIRIRGDLCEEDEKPPPEWQKALATAHISRGNCFSQLNQPSDALEDYKKAIIILVVLRRVLGEQFSTEWQNELANAHIFRGHLFSQINQPGDSLEDYNKAISIRRELCEKDAQFSPESQNNLADAFICRGLVFRQTNQLSDALEDYNAAIRIRGNLCEKNEQSPPGWQNKLADALIFRGGLLRRQNKISSSLTLEDYNSAIRIRSDLRKVMGEEFPPKWQNKLANELIKRGNLFSQLSQLSNAHEDYSAAIRIRSDLRKVMGKECPPEWQNKVADDFINRADLILGQRNLDQFSDVLEDYNAAIRIRSDLRKLIDEEFPPEWQNKLDREIRFVAGN